MMDQVEREEMELEQAYERGELTQKEYMREMAELRRSVQAEARERAQEAYDREMDKW